MSPLTRNGFGDRRRDERQRGNRRPLIIAGVVLILLVAWSYIALSFGSGEETGGAASETTRETASRTAPATIPDSPAYAEGGGTGGSNGTSEGTDDTGGGIPAEEGDSTGRDSAGSLPSQQPGGATNEPGSYDPLGKESSGEELAFLDEKRLRFSVATFISTAYGYSGTDEDAYNQDVGETVVWPDFYDSEGSSEIERYAGQVADTGTRSAALLNSFEPSESSAESVTGYAYFETGSGYTSDGGIAGDKETYRQQITLTSSGAVWKVEAVQDIEEVR